MDAFGVKYNLFPFYFYPTQCCGSGMFIPDPNFFHPGSELKDIVQPKKRWVERGAIRTVLTSYTIADIF
jgi:hypothetical protein